MHNGEKHQSRLWTYIEDNLAARGLGTAQLAEALGVHRSRFTDWKRGKSLHVETARAMAKFFDKPILEILIVGGLLTPDEVNPGGIRPALSDYPTATLMLELNHRLHAREVASADAPPADGAP